MGRMKNKTTRMRDKRTMAGEEDDEGEAKWMGRARVTHKQHILMTHYHA